MQVGLPPTALGASRSVPWLAVVKVAAPITEFGAVSCPQFVVMAAVAPSSLGVAVNRHPTVHRCQHHDRYQPSSLAPVSARSLVTGLHRWRRRTLAQNTPSRHAGWINYRARRPSVDGHPTLVMRSPSPCGGGAVRVVPAQSLVSNVLRGRSGCGCAGRPQRAGRDEARRSVCHRSARFVVVR